MQSYRAIITIFDDHEMPVDPGFGHGAPTPPHVGGGPMPGAPGHVGGGPVVRPPHVGGGPVHPGMPPVAGQLPHMPPPHVGGGPLPGGQPGAHPSNPIVLPPDHVVPPIAPGGPGAPPGAGTKPVGPPTHVVVWVPGVGYVAVDLSLVASQLPGGPPPVSATPLPPTAQPKPAGR